MEDRNPRILRGDLAQLSDLRNDMAAPSEAILFSDTVKATWKDDDDVAFESVAGKAIVTTERILFVAKVEEKHDVAVDSECILLHATAQGPPSIYLQLQEMSAELAAPMELTLVPDTESSCQAFFEALSKLVAMHPIDDDDIDDGEEGMMFMCPAKIEDGEDTVDEREVMLDRLDNMLEVPPHLEVDDGQFDDADELL